MSQFCIINKTSNFVLLINQEGPRTLDRSQEPLSRGEDVDAIFSRPKPSLGIIQTITKNSLLIM